MCNTVNSGKYYVNHTKQVETQDGSQRHKGTQGKRSRGGAKTEGADGTVQGVEAKRGLRNQEKRYQ